MAAEDYAILLELLRRRFEKNPGRHKGLLWPAIEKKLKENPDKLHSLNEMEKTGGEPDVIGFDKKSGEYRFCDCSAESPSGRRSLCYDREARESRKEAAPGNDVLSMAEAMGIDLLDEKEYFDLQKLGDFDTKTSSWLKTPPELRALGGALFGDRRYGRVFIYHNGAASYYGARGFRGSLKI
ncbi:MAG: DUF4256 domain-containing protein [Spirochaetales bacterium]|jgi:hypothetical protein|nr:DUF4256 domain-containing protein [Spirochaetales bacterium]